MQRRKKFVLSSSLRIPDPSLLGDPQTYQPAQEMTLSITWYQSLFVSSLVRGNLGFACLRRLQIKSINMIVQVFIQTYVSILIRQMQKSRIARPYGKLMFNFVKYCQDIFQNVSAILYSYQQSISVTVILQHYQNMKIVRFLVIIILEKSFNYFVYFNDIQLYLITVLICFSLITNNIEHLFT